MNTNMLKKRYAKYKKLVETSICLAVMAFLLYLGTLAYDAKAYSVCVWLLTFCCVCILVICEILTDWKIPDIDPYSF